MERSWPAGHLGLVQRVRVKDVLVSEGVQALRVRVKYVRRAHVSG